MSLPFEVLAHRLHAPARILHPARMHAEAEPEDIYTAEEDALADVARYTEWLADALAGEPPVYTTGVFRMDVFQDSLGRRSLAYLQAYQLYPRAEVSYSCTEELKRRYFAIQQACVERETARIAEGRQA